MTTPITSDPNSGKSLIPGTPEFNAAVWNQAMQDAGVRQQDDLPYGQTPPASPLAGFLIDNTLNPSVLPTDTPTPSILSKLLEMAGRALPYAGAGAILLTPWNASSQQGETSVAGHPELGAHWERGTGAFNGTVTIYSRGSNGQPTSAGLKLDMDADGRLTGKPGTPLAGVAVGTLARDPSMGVQLAPGLDQPLDGQAPAGAETAAPLVSLSPNQVGVAYEARTPEEAARADEMRAQGKNGNDIAAELDRMRGSIGTGQTTTTELRKQPGTATMSTPLPDVTGDWLRGSHGNAGLIPGQVAAKLQGRQFKNWDDFRGSFWKAVANTPELSSQFSKANRTFMKRGEAPVTPEEQHYGSKDTYILHHRDPLANGGGLYDMSNIAVVTPKMHQSILDPKFHFGGTSQ